MADSLNTRSLPENRPDFADLTRNSSATTRRAVIAGLAATAVLPSVEALASPDAELLGLHRRWTENERDWNSSSDESDEGTAAFLARAAELEWQIVAIPAQTLAGLVVKLSLVCDTGSVLTFGDDDAPSHAARAALEDARRLAGMTGAA